MPLRLEVVVDDTVELLPAERLVALAAFTGETESSIGSGIWTATLRVTDDDTISAIHGQFFGDPTPTDVISFPSGELDEGTDGYLGDIVVSADTAAHQAADAGHPTEREIAFLLLHGVLHLCGYDDLSPPDRDRMLARQESILSAFEATETNAL